MEVTPKFTVQGRIARSGHIENLELWTEVIKI